MTDLVILKAYCPGCRNNVRTRSDKAKWLLDEGFTRVEFVCPYCKTEFDSTTKLLRQEKGELLLFEEGFHG